MRDEREDRWWGGGVQGEVRGREQRERTEIITLKPLRPSWGEGKETEKKEKIKTS